MDYEAVKKKIGVRTDISKNLNRDIEETLAREKIHFEERGVMTLAYLRYRGEYNWKLGLHWMKFMGLLKRKHIIPHDAELYGIGYENPDFARAEQCYYDSCIRVEDGFALSPGLSTLTIPSFRYGVFPFKGTGEELQNLFFFIYGTWLEEEGLYPAEGPVLQRIKAAPKGPVLDLELMLPVVKK